MKIVHVPTIILACFATTVAGRLRHQEAGEVHQKTAAVVHQKQAGGAQHQQAGGAQHQKAGGAQHQKAGGAQHQKAGGAQHQKAGGALMAVSESLRRRINGCSTADIVYFNAKYAEFADRLSTAAESLAVALAMSPDPEQTRVDFFTDNLDLPYAIMLREYLTDNTADDFTAAFSVRNRNLVKDAPVFNHTYASMDEFYAGTEFNGTIAVPGFWSILAVRDGRWLNPSGGSSGYSTCFEDGTAETTIRTIDVYASMTRDNEPADGFLDSEVALARINIGWIERDGDWKMSSISMDGELIGYVSYGSYANSEA